MEKQKATIYYSTEFFGSIQSIECYLVEHGTREYAQYKNAPYVKFIPKGKRKICQIIKGYQPYILIVENWNQPKPDGLYSEDTKTNNNVVICESKYQSFDDRYKSDFDNIIENSNVEIIADYRNINTYNKF